jgi:transposase-like protein
MSSKVNDHETGRKVGFVVSDPRWKCPSCKIHVNEPFAKRCRTCREKDKREADITKLDPLLNRLETLIS